MDMDALLKRKEDELSDRIVRTDEVVYDGQLEQGVELDYALPDYYPEIFRILKCTLSPKIISYSVSPEGKLSIDGIVGIKVMYLTEGSPALYCIDQRYSFTKTADMGKKNFSANDMPRIAIMPKSDYCNCRAVSPRRIDVRGAISCKVKVTAPAQYILPEIPEGLQVKNENIRCCGKTLFSEKQFTIREEIETGAAGIGFIIESNCVPKITDVRVIADKAVIKGMVTLNALYGLFDPENSGCISTESMNADIPVSAILDIDGITDTHITSPELSVTSCELLPKSDSGIISCEILVRVGMSAFNEGEAVLATDLYSTEYETEFSTAPIRICTLPRPVSKQFSLKSTLSCDNGEVRSVSFCSAEINNLSCRPANGDEMTLSGQICASATGYTTEGAPFFIEKQEAFEQSIPAADVCADTVSDFTALVTDTGFSIKSDGTLDITTQADFSGMLRNIRTINAINAVTVHEDKPKARDDDSALRIFYSNDGEDAWSIAKRCNTTVSAVMSENDIEDENAPLSGMILIPTI